MGQVLSIENPTWITVKQQIFICAGNIHELRKDTNRNVFCEEPQSLSIINPVIRSLRTFPAG